MTYPAHHRYKGENLLPAEREVQAALMEAGYDWDGEYHWDWFTPTNELYQEYVNYVNRLQWREERGALTKQQFGIALRRVWGWDLRQDTKDTHTRRRVHGKRVCGVYHLKGPATVRVLDGKGRRPKDHDHFVD